MGTDQTADVDILVIGAGVTGIYQLYLAREAGYSVQLVDAGTGVGGTWYWNRYPGSRYDSESYTYGAGDRKELPYGGFRKSGYGREKGVEALDAYTATKTIVVQL